MIGRLRQFAARFWHDTHASIAAESVLLALPLVTTLIGTLEYGRLVWVQNSLQQVATLGARCAGLHAVSCSDAGDPRTFNATKTVSYVTTEAANWSVSLATGNIAATASTTCQSIAGLAQVTINYPFQSGILGLFGFGSYPVTATACYPNQS